MLDPTHETPASTQTRLASLFVLALPAVVLAVLAIRCDSRLLVIGTFTEILGAALFVRGRVAWRPPVSASVILLYVMALGWAWFSTQGSDDPIAAFSRGLLLLIAVLLLFSHDLHRSGAEARRRAKWLCGKIRRRRQWPTDPTMLSCLPEVLALREAVEHDASLLFGLFNDNRPEVRMAAFAALENRKVWRPVEVSVVMHKAKQMVDPAVRAMAIVALGSVRDPITIVDLTSFLRDPEPCVRVAAIRAALVNPNQRWVFVRENVRAYLSDPRFANDGGLPGTAGKLPAVAICDLTSWASEPLPLCTRSMRALIEHYAYLLRSGIDYDLVHELAQQVLDPHSPAGLRVELANLLQAYHLLTPDLLDRMTNSDQPGPLRLLAAEAMLKMNPSDPDALDVLRGLGRQPNRELAIGVAKVLQKYLGFDMGLSADRLALNSKIAADVVKNVLKWATARSMNNSTNPTPGYAIPGLPETPPPLGLTKTGPPAASRVQPLKKPW